MNPFLHIEDRGTITFVELPGWLRLIDQVELQLINNVLGRCWFNEHFFLWITVGYSEILAKACD